MGVKFFGQYVVQQGVVTREKLLQALAVQEVANRRFGEMAISMGLLTEAEVAKAHAAQLSEDIPFGEMAVKIGLLTQGEVRQVLTRQRNSHIFIGRALVEVGALTAAQLEHHLQEFQRDLAPGRMEAVTIPDGVPLPQLWEIAADTTCKMLTRLGRLPCRMEQCRPVHRLEGDAPVFAMDFSGSANARYLLALSAGLRDSIARAILREEDVSSLPEEVLEDAGMEFVNIVCGNVAARAAQLGYPLEIHPPEILRPGKRGVEVPAGHTGLLFPIHVVSSEQVQMALFINRWGL